MPSFAFGYTNTLVSIGGVGYALLRKWVALGGRIAIARAIGVVAYHDGRCSIGASVWLALVGRKIVGHAYAARHTKTLVVGWVLLA